MVLFFKFDVVVVIGDLIDCSDFCEYVFVCFIFLCFDMLVYLVLGNYDGSIDMLCEMVFFLGMQDVCFSKVCYMVDIGIVWLIMLDIYVFGKLYGLICKDQFDWLDQEFSVVFKLILVVFYYLLVIIGIWYMDVIGLINFEQLVVVILRYDYVE